MSARTQENSGLCLHCQAYYPVPEPLGPGRSYACPRCGGILRSLEEADEITLVNATPLPAPPADYGDGRWLKVLSFYPTPSPEVVAARSAALAEANGGGLWGRLLSLLRRVRP